MNTERTIVILKSSGHISCRGQNINFELSGPNGSDFVWRLTLFGDDWTVGEALSGADVISEVLGQKGAYCCQDQTKHGIQAFMLDNKFLNNEFYVGAVSDCIKAVSYDIDKRRQQYGREQNQQGA